MSYIKGIDGLRALAVGLVLIHHWVPEDVLINQYPNGPLGVTIFFVLSGFLISRILFAQKERIEAGTLAPRTLLWRFTARRALRIFPIYYLTILFLALTESYTKTAIVADLGYYLTYTSNILFYTRDAWSGIASHTWSLAVEEQFYLIWPLLVVATPMRWLRRMIVLITLIGFAFPYLLDSPFEIILTPATFLSFGTGAGLAGLERYRPATLQNWSRFRWQSALAVLGLLLLLYLAGIDLDLPPYLVHSTLAAYLIHICLYPPEKSWFISVMTYPAVAFMGRISYGIYLYHLLVPRYWELVCQKLGGLGDILRPDSWPILFVEYFLITLLISWLSWRFIEQPILRFKHRVAY